MSANAVARSDLERIIEERRIKLKEKLKQKRQEDLQLIKSINSKNEGGRHPLSILPKEMWATVLNYLNDPSDLEAVWNSCPLFQSLLKGRYLSGILMPKLLQVPNFVDMFLDDEYKLAEALWESKMFKKVITQYYSEDLEHCLLDQLLRKRKEARKSLAPEDPFLFKDKFGDVRNLQVEYCPVSRSVHIFLKNFIDDIDPLGQDRQFKQSFERLNQKFMEFLEKMGSNLWSFQVKLEFNYLTLLPDIYTTIHSWVSEMFHIKILSLQFSFMPRDDWLPEYGDQFLIKDAIYNNPFPHLKHLKTLKFKYCEILISVGGMPLIESILKANSHVKNLAISGVYCDRRVARVVKLVKNMDLESLYIKCGDDSSHMQALETIRNPEWKLKALKLCFDGLSSGRLRSLVEILKFVEKFQTLESLTLDLGDDGRKFLKTLRNEDSSFYLNLPQLRNFSLDILTYPEDSDLVQMRYRTSVDYLLKCEKLEKLTFISYPLPEAWMEGEGNDLIQFKGGMCNLLRSNIWKVFPSLKSVITTREMNEDIIPREYRRNEVHEMNIKF